MSAKNIVTKHTIWLLVLVIISLALFSNTFQNSFTWDDKSFIVKNVSIRSIKNIPSFFTPQYWQGLFLKRSRTEPLLVAIYRPLSMISFAFDYLLWRLNPAGFHLTNILLHALSVILVYFFVYRLLRGVESSDSSTLKIYTRSDPLNIPFITALIFASHPIHVESVTWIKNRADLLAFVFFISSLLFFIRYIENSHNKLDIFSYLASLICFIFAFLSKAIAFSLPLILVAYILCLLPKEQYQKTLIKVSPFFLTVVLYFIFKGIFLKMPLIYGEMPGLDLSTQISLVIKTIGYYMNLLILPVNLNAERLFIIPRSFIEPAVYFSLTLLFFILAVIIKTFPLKDKSVSESKYSRLFCFSTLWFLLTLLPVSNIIFLFSRPIAEQRLYLPSLGFCLILAVGINKISHIDVKLLSQNKLRVLAGLISFFIFAFYSVTTLRRNADWRDPFTLWTKTVKSSPHSPRAHNNLGDAYEKKGLFDQAIKEYREALRLNPGRSEFYHNLGNVYYAKGLFDQAIKEYKQALEIDPAALDTHYNLANVYDSKGLYDQAIKEYQEVLGLAPEHTDAHNNLGNAYEKKGLFDQAIKEYKQALEIDPQFAAAYNNLGYLYLEMDIMIDEAIRLIKKALSLNPGNPEIMDSLGWAYYKNGLLDQALAQLKEAALLLPNHPEVQQHLDAVYDALGSREE